MVFESVVANKGSSHPIRHKNTSNTPRHTPRTHTAHSISTQALYIHLLSNLLSDTLQPARIIHGADDVALLHAGDDEALARRELRREVVLLAVVLAVPL